jgi:hypothetical protein
MGLGLQWGVVQRIRAQGDARGVGCGNGGCCHNRGRDDSHFGSNGVRAWRSHLAMEGVWPVCRFQAMVGQFGLGPRSASACRAALLCGPGPVNHFH